MHCPARVRSRNETADQSGVVPKKSLRPFPSRYLLKEELGSGGFCTVRRALDRKTGREVAIKRLHEHMTTAKGALPQLLNEMIALTRLRDRRIVSLLDVDYDWGGPYLVTEYVPGMALDNVIKQLNNRPILTALRIASEACATLDIIHSQGIVHRDISPQNIILTSQPPYIKLIDFGCVFLPNAYDAAQEGLLVGKFKYMSPEQTYFEKVDGRSDLYSLGVMTYMMLNYGYHPYSSTVLDDAELIEAHRNRTPVPMPNLAIPQEIINLVERALEKRPCDRFSSAFEMKAAIDDQITLLRASC